MLKIDKDIPLPTARVRNERFYPTNTMEVGDSFFVADGELRLGVLRAGISSAAKRSGIKVTTRKVEGGYRAWRYE